MMYDVMMYDVYRIEMKVWCDVIQVVYKSGIT